MDEALLLDLLPKGFEDVIQCPFDNSHQILRTRMQTHIVKCKKNFPNSNLRMCPFNSCHYVSDLNAHVKSCSDRAVLEHYTFQSTDSRASARQNTYHTDYREPVNESSENWDDEDVPTYDPLKHVENANIIRKAVGTRSERKKFRAAERIRLQNIED